MTFGEFKWAIGVDPHRPTQALFPSTTEQFAYLLATPNDDAPMNEMTTLVSPKLESNVEALGWYRTAIHWPKRHHFYSTLAEGRDQLTGAVVVITLKGADNDLRHDRTVYTENEADAIVVRIFMDEARRNL